MNAGPLLQAAEAARLFLDAQGLLAPRVPKETAGDELDVLQTLGFVQVDTIRVCGRAQDLILHARLEGYREGAVWEHLNGHRLFEAFTHDASLIPVEWYPQWRHRWRRDEPRIQAHPWWQKLLGENAGSVCRHVLARITEEGPLRSADFEHPERRGPWWGWKPEKAALDYLWRTGRLAVTARKGFQKCYDLPERAFPESHALPEPSAAEHQEWAFSSAASRLVCFTPRELAAFWDLLGLPEARIWCEKAALDGRLAKVRIESADGSGPQTVWGIADWKARLASLPDPLPGLRLLAPFDPVVRDRGRLLRRFGFTHTFEGFVPEAKRQFGYYVLPILEGCRFVGRVEPRLTRDRKGLVQEGLWWESGVRATGKRLKALESELERLAGMLGVARA